MTGIRLGQKQLLRQFRIISYSLRIAEAFDKGELIRCGGNILYPVPKITEPVWTETVCISDDVTAILDSREVLLWVRI